MANNYFLELGKTALQETAKAAAPTVQKFVAESKKQEALKKSVKKPIIKKPTLSLDEFMAKHPAENTSVISTDLQSMLSKHPPENLLTKIQSGIRAIPQAASTFATAIQKQDERIADLTRRAKTAGLGESEGQELARLTGKEIKKFGEQEPIYKDTSIGETTGEEIEATPLAPYVKTGLDIAKPFLKKEIKPSQVLETIEKGKEFIDELRQKSASEQKAFEIYKQQFTTEASKDPSKSIQYAAAGAAGIEKDAREAFNKLPDTERQSLNTRVHQEEVAEYNQYLDDQRNKLAEQLADPGGLRANQYFPDSVVRKYVETPTEEREAVLKEALIDLPKEAVRGFLDGMSFGIVSQVASKKLARQEPTFEENKELQEFNEGIGNAVNIVSQFAGGVPTYSVVAAKVGQALKGIPKVGTFLSEHPILTSYVVQNVGEEMVEAGVRKATGQEYGIADFGLGILLGGGMEGLGRIMTRTPLFKNVSPSEVASKFETSLKEAEEAKGSTLNNREVQDTLLNTSLVGNLYGRDLFSEARLLHKTMRDQGFVERGRMTSLQGVTGVPAIKEFGEDVGARSGILRDMEQEVTKRKAIEESIAKGEYSKADEILKDMGPARRGLINPIVEQLDKVLSVPLKGLRWAAYKAIDALPKGFKEGVNHTFKKQQNIEDSLFKIITEKKRAETREMTGIQEIIEPLKQLDDSQKKLAGEYIRGKEVEGLEPGVKETLDVIRREIDIEGLRQVQAGKLDPEVYFKNMGSYIRRLYSVHGSPEFQPLAESYNHLKNALIKERNLDGREAEKVITDILMGNVKDVPVGIKPSGIKTEGDFLKKRKLGEGEVDMAIRDFLGEIKDPEYLVARTLLELKQARMNQEFLARLSETDAMKDTIPANQADKWIKLSSDQYGTLKGKYLREDVFEYLELEKQKSGKFLKTMNAINNFIKGNLTSRNIGGQVRNMASNFAVSQSILGHNFFSPSGFVEISDAYKSLKNKDDFYDELLNYGQIGDTGLKQELGQTLDDIVKQQLGKSPNKLLDKWRALDSWLGDKYQLGDNLFLMANYKKLRQKGLTPEAAVVQARRVTPDYGDVNPLIKKFRQSLIGVPFMTWRYKVYPELLKSFIEKPLQTSMPLSIPFAVGSTLIESGTLPMTNEEKQMAYTRLFRDGKITVGRSEDGDLISVDFGSYTPFSDMFKGSQKKKGEPLSEMLPDQLYGYVQGSVPGLASFPAQDIYNIFIKNQNPFTGKQIFNPDEGAGNMFADIFTYLAPQLVPLAGVPLQKSVRAAEKEESVPAAITEALTGVKVREEGVGEFEKTEQYRDPDFDLDENQTLIRQKVREAARVAGSSVEEANKILNEMYDKYPSYEKYINDRYDAEVDKIEGKSKIQNTIRQEITTLNDLAQIDPERANKRLNQLYDDYPEYEKYITKKHDEITAK